MGFPASAACGILQNVNTRAICCLCCALYLASPAQAYTGYGDDNPFVEAMLRMMEIMGLIDRGPVPLGVPYMPGAGGMPGWGGHPGAGMLAGSSPMGAWGNWPGPGMPGMTPYPGMGGWPGSGMPGMSDWSSGGIPGLSGLPGGSGFRYGPDRSAVADLDGIWELSNGSVVIIKGQAARLYLTRERHQDFVIGYDGKHFWWSPRGSNVSTRYLYQMRDGRMILRDNDGKVLLMRRRS